MPKGADLFEVFLPLSNLVTLRERCVRWFSQCRILYGCLADAWPCKGTSDYRHPSEEGQAIRGGREFIASVLRKQAHL